MKQLNINLKPPVSYFSHHAMFLSVLMNDNEYEEWLYNNFITIHLIDQEYEIIEYDDIIPM